MQKLNMLVSGEHDLFLISKAMLVEDESG